MIKLVKELPPQQIEWRNNDSIMKWCRQNIKITPEMQRKWELSVLNDPSVNMFGIKYNDVFVGTCGLTSIRNSYKGDHRTAEYSLLLGPEHQGRHYAIPAMELLLEYGFTYLRLIWGEIFEHNEAGLRIAKKLGFKEEARLRARYIKDGQLIDTIIFSLTKEEWEASWQ